MCINEQARSHRRNIAMAITCLRLKPFLARFPVSSYLSRSMQHKKGLLVGRTVIEEAPYGFPHDLRDGNVASIRVIHMLLQLNVQALWNDQTAISSSWHSLPQSDNCLFKVSIFPILPSYHRHLSSTSTREFNDIYEHDDLARKLVRGERANQRVVSGILPAIALLMRSPPKMLIAPWITLKTARKGRRRTAAVNDCA